MESDEAIIEKEGYYLLAKSYCSLHRESNAQISVSIMFWVCISTYLGLRKKMSVVNLFLLLLMLKFFHNKSWSKCCGLHKGRAWHERNFDHIKTDKSLMTDDKDSEMYDLCIVNKQIRNQHVRNLSVIEKKIYQQGKNVPIINIRTRNNHTFIIGLRFATKVLRSCH